MGLSDCDRYILEVPQFASNPIDEAWLQCGDRTSAANDGGTDHRSAGAELCLEQNRPPGSPLLLQVTLFALRLGEQGVDRGSKLLGGLRGLGTGGERNTLGSDQV